jgi:hypothetical protein
MPVIYQKFIYRVDLQANPHILYLFGDNLKRQGLGGQAKEMRGEPNAVGIATKKLPSQYENSYFCDDDFDLFEDHYLVDMEPVYKHLALDGILIIPLDGLGTGLSELPERAPKIDNYIKTAIRNLVEVYG